MGGSGGGSVFLPLRSLSRLEERPGQEPARRSSTTTPPGSVSHGTCRPPNVCLEPSGPSHSPVPACRGEHPGSGGNRITESSGGGKRHPEVPCAPSGHLNGMPASKLLVASSQTPHAPPRAFCVRVCPSGKQAMKSHSSLPRRCVLVQPRVSVDL